MELLEQILNVIWCSCIVQRKTSSGAGDDKSDVNAADGSLNDIKSSEKKEHVQPASNLVFGYLNLFSDGVVSRCSLPLALELLFTCAWSKFHDCFKCSGLLYLLTVWNGPFANIAA